MGGDAALRVSQLFRITPLTASTSRRNTVCGQRLRLRPRRPRLKPRRSLAIYAVIATERLERQTGLGVAARCRRHGSLASIRSGQKQPIGVRKETSSPLVTGHWVYNTAHWRAGTAAVAALTAVASEDHRCKILDT